MAAARSAAVGCAAAERELGFEVGTELSAPAASALHHRACVRVGAGCGRQAARAGVQRVSTYLVWRALRARAASRVRSLAPRRPSPSRASASK